MKVFKILLLILGFSFILCGCKEEHVHEWDGGQIINKPTCTEAGLIGFKCKTCDETKLDVIPVTSHDYKEEITKPTCTEKGYTTHTCSTCNHSYIDSYVDALGHNEVVDEAVDSTCTKKGLTKGIHCDRCNKTIIEQEETELKKHNYDNFICVDCDFHFYTEGLIFTLSDDKKSYVVSDYNGDDIDVIVPYLYNGIPVISISQDAFYNCSGLESITLPFVGESLNGKSNTHFGFIFGASSSSYNDDYVPTSLKEVIITGGTSIGSSAFWNCSSLTSIVIPDSIKSIGNYAFSGCSSLTSIVIPDSVRSIDYRAFSGCSSLTSIVIPDSVRSIDYRAFSGCSSLTSITIPNSVTSISGYAFSGCSSLTSITIPNSVTSIGEYAFSGCSFLTSIVIPFRVTSIGEYAFENCSSLENVYYNGTILDWLNIIFSNYNSNPMYYADNLYMIDENGDIEYNGKKYKLSTDVVIPDSVTSIDEGAFKYCSSLTSIVIPDSVISIGKSAFYNCSSLESIVIPEGVTSIGKSAFDNCSRLENVYYNGTILDWLNIIFSNYNSNPMYYADNLYMIDENGNIEYNGKKYKLLTDVVIPDSVTSIRSEAFENCSSLTSIVIPDSVTSIGYDAFSNCSSLTSVTFKEGSQLTSIGSYAFSNCSSLTSIVIPDSVTSIGSSTFSDCSSLTSMTLPFVGGSLNGTRNTHFGYIFGASSSSYNDDYVPTSLKEVIITGGTSIENSAFENCSSLTSIEIPEGVTSIGYEAFENCSSLTSIVIPDSVTSISGYAFSGCKRLIMVVIPDSVTSISYGAFFCDNYSNYNLTIYCEASEKPSGWNSKWISSSAQVYWGINYIEIDKVQYEIQDNKAILTSYKGNDSEVSIPSIIKVNGKGYNVTSIGSSAFSGCKSLTSIVIPDSVTSISEYAFSGCSFLTSIVIPDSVRSIGYSAFSGCSSLTSITIPNSVTSIGNYAFNGCSSLTSIVIPESVTSIGECAFRHCSSLKNVYYNGTIEDWLKIKFSGDDSTPMYYADNLYMIDENGDIEYNDRKYKLLTEVVIPEGVTTIGKYAFYNCSGLESITLPSTLTNVGSYAFSDCSSLENVYYNGTIEDWLNITFSASNSTPMYYVDNLYMIDENGDIEYNGKKYKLLTDVVIPEGVTSIGEYAFYYCSSLTSITIPNSVTSIGNYAFNGCSSLTSIVIPESVTSIGECAFRHCRSLTSITIPKGVTSIGSKAFKYCSSLTSIVIPNSVKSIGWGTFYNCSGLTSITIPNSVTIIDSSTFSDCSSLTSIEIPNSVTVIECDAFENCSSLKNVYYNGTILDWLNIKFYYNYYSYSTLMYYADNLYMIDENGDIEYNGKKYKLLTDVIVPDSVTSIGEYAFENCSSLTSITIPNSVTSIGYNAFSDCSSLENVYYNGTIEDWLNIKFSYNYNYYSNPTYYADNLYMIDENGDKEYNGQKYKLLTEVVVSEGVTSIGEYDFCGCSSLTSIVIPDSVTSIGSYAFVNCSSLTIYCEASSKPSGWNSNWNYSKRPVYWAGEWEYDANGNPVPLS